MSHKDDDRKSTPPPSDPALQDVEPGSDADVTPTPPVGQTPPNPNSKDETAEKSGE
jgi:hypothetical protein